MRRKVVGGLVRLGMLGPLSVTGPHGVDVAVPCHRQRVVLAALAMRANRVVSVDELADVVWDGTRPSDAPARIRAYVIGLRTVLGAELGARVVARDAGYLWRAEPDELDLLEFERLCDLGDDALRQHAWSEAADLLTAALLRWRGTPLQDVPSDRLRAAELPRLERLRVLATRGRSAAHRELRGRADAERLGAQLAAYQRIHADLVDRLGVAPLPTSSTATASATVRVPRQLPPESTHFVGRTHEFRMLSELLPTCPPAGGAVPIAVIAGAAGIGKTALVLRWAHRNAHHFPDGRLFVNLRDCPSDPTSISTVLRGFLDALGVPRTAIPADIEAQVSLYRSRLAGKRVLVLLDNARDGEQVRRLLPGSAGCMAVVTSRSQLPGLVVVNGAAPLSLEPLSARDSRQLLVTRLGSSRVAAEPGAVGDLVRLAGGNPLTLHLVAGRVPWHTEQPLADLATELRAEPDAVVEFACAALPPAAVRALRLISAHPGPDVSTAAVASLIGTDIRHATAVLDELARANLLTEHLPGRFTCHDLVHDHAVEHRDRHETRQALRRLLDHYLHAARAVAAALDQADMPIDPPAPGVVVPGFADVPHALAWCDDEQAALFAVLRHASAAGKAQQAWQLAYFLATLSLRADTRDRWADTQRAALAATERGNDVAGQAHLHRLLAGTLTRSGRHAAAAAHLAKANTLFHRLGDPHSESAVQHELAATRIEQNDAEQALRHGRSALRLAKQSGDRAGQAVALYTIGGCQTLLGRPTDALRDFMTALTLFDQLDDAHGAAVTQRDLARLQARLGNESEAECWRTRALNAIAGVDIDSAETQVRLGDTFDAVGDRTAARQAWATALTMLADRPANLPVVLPC